jgi:hypothetical protein
VAYSGCFFFFSTAGESFVLKEAQYRGPPPEIVLRGRVFFLQQPRKFCGPKPVIQKISIQSMYDSSLGTDAYKLI